MTGNPTSRHPAPRIEFLTRRHTFVRGETPLIRLRLVNDSRASTPALELHCEVAGACQHVIRVDPMGPGDQRSASVRLDTGTIRSGSYELDCLVEGERAAVFPFVVARPPNPDRIPFHLWCDDTVRTAFVDGVTDVARKALGLFRDLGFDAVSIGVCPLEEDTRAVLDYALEQGVEIGFSPVGYDRDGLLERPELRNTESEKHLCPYHPDILSAVESSVAEAMKRFGQHPALRFFWASSEVDWPQCRCERCDRLAQDRLGFGLREPIPDTDATSGTIPDDDRRLRYVKYYRRYGMGDAVHNELRACTVHAYRSDVVVWSDPFRLAALYDFFRGEDMVSTWTYTNPDPKLMAFIEHLVAVARPRQQKVMHTISMWNYGGSVVPSRNRFDRMKVVSMGPDRFTETAWINLAWKTDVLSVYFSSNLNPLNDPRLDINDAIETRMRELAPHRKKQPRIPDGDMADFILCPQREESMRQFSRDVLAPFGPMVRHLDRSPRRAAILDSFSSRLYRVSPRQQGYYDNLQIYSLYCLLLMAHIPTDVLFDETIERYGLDDYEVLFLPVCDTLTESNHRRICEFARRGGTVVVDQHFRADVPGAIRVDHDLTFRNLVRANAIELNWDFMELDDLPGHLDTAERKARGTRGVTAREDQNLMERFAEDLRARLDPWTGRYADSTSMDVVLNVLEKGGVKVVFAINDKRDYGERLGQWQAILEKGVPQTVGLSVADEFPESEPVLYELTTRREINWERRDGRLWFQLDLPPAGGRIVVVSPRRIATVSLDCPETMAPGRTCTVCLRILDEAGAPVPGVQPVRVDLEAPDGSRSEYSDYFAAADGTFVFRFTPAVNDPPGRWQLRIRELVTGREATAELNCVSRQVADDE